MFVNIALIATALATGAIALPQYPAPVVAAPAPQVQPQVISQPQPIISQPQSQVISQPQVGNSAPISFNNWRGISSMNGFDNFYGSGNFVNEDFSQTIVQENQVVCHSQSIEIIQQRLLILQEMAKRIISEQICEVETQTIVFEQFSSNLNLFGGDLSRESHHQVGYDSNIVSHYNGIFNSDGSLSNNDLGFSGQDLGHSVVVPVGNNWNDESSPSIIEEALSDCNEAVLSSPH